MWPFVGVVCLLRGSVGLEYGLVSLGLHCFLRLARALCWRSGRCLVGDAFSVLHSDHALLSMQLACQKPKQKRKPNRGLKQWNRKRMYDEDAVEQYQKMLVESLTSVDMEEDVNATGKALTVVISSAAMKCFGQCAPFGRRAYWWTDDYGTVQKECCALYETYRTTMTRESRTQFNNRRIQKNNLK